MEYSLQDVFYYLYRKHGEALYLIEDLEEQFDQFYNLVEDASVGDTIVLDIPEFTGKHMDNGIEKTFSPKQFNITITKFHSGLKDSYEGKSFYNNYTDFVDNNTQKKLTIISSFYSAIDTNLTGLAIHTTH